MSAVSAVAGPRMRAQATRTALLLDGPILPTCCGWRGRTFW